MRGTVYRSCWCRDPETGRPPHRRCPKLARKSHGKWYARYDADGGDGKRRQPVLGPYSTKKEAEEELAAAVARIGGGRLGTRPFPAGRGVPGRLPRREAQPEAALEGD